MMGVFNSIYSCEKSHYAFVGRSKEEDIFKKLLEENKIIGVYGMKKIGKSRFIARRMQTLEKEPDTMRLLCDFDVEDNEDYYYNCMEEFFKTFEHQSKQLKMLKNFNRCGNCRNCKFNQNSCEKLLKAFKCIASDLDMCFNKSKKTVYLTFDNVDVIIHTAAKEYFMELIHNLSLTCKCIKIILSSTYKFQYSHKLFAELELRPIEDSYIEDLLHDITKGKFKEKQVYMMSISKMCEGLPIAAEMAGALLLNDEGFLTPEELVELLIVTRLKALSPETFPGSDRLDQLQNAIVDFESAENDSQMSFGKLLSLLILPMTSTEITVDEAMTASDTKVSKAIFKHTSLKPFVDRSIATRCLGRLETLQIHRFFRECKLALEILRCTEKEGGPLEEGILQLRRENAQRAGLNVEDNVLNDPIALEKAIGSLGIQETPGKDTEGQTPKQNEEITPSDKKGSKNRQVLPEQPVQPLANGCIGDNSLNIVNTSGNQVIDGQLNISDTTKTILDHQSINRPPITDDSELLYTVNEPEQFLESNQQPSLEDNEQIPFPSMNQSHDVNKIQVRYSSNNCSTENKLEFENIYKKDKVNLRSSKNGCENSCKTNDKNGSNIMLSPQTNIVSEELIINNSNQSQCMNRKHLPVEHDDDTMNHEGPMSKKSLHISSDKSKCLTQTKIYPAKTENIHGMQTHDGTNVNHERSPSLSAEDKDVDTSTKQPDALCNGIRDENDTSLDNQTHRESYVSDNEGNLSSNDKNENDTSLDNQTHRESYVSDNEGNLSSNDKNENDTSLDNQTHRESYVSDNEGNLSSNDKNENNFLTDNFLSEVFRDW